MDVVTVRGMFGEERQGPEPDRVLSLGESLSALRADHPALATAIRRRDALLPLLAGAPLEPAVRRELAELRALVQPVARPETTLPAVPEGTWAPSLFARQPVPDEVQVRMLGLEHPDMPVADQLDSLLFDLTVPALDCGDRLVAVEQSTPPFVPARSGTLRALAYYWPRPGVWHRFAVPPRAVRAGDVDTVTLDFGPSRLLVSVT